MFKDRHTGCINRKIFSDSLPKCSRLLKCFSGGKTKDLEHYVPRTLNEHKPDIVVVHIGSNNIDFRQLYYNTVTTS